MRENALKIIDFLHILKFNFKLMPKIIVVFFLSIFNYPIKAEIDNDALRACLPASDFQGCMKVYKKSSVSNENKRIENNDFLGLPVPEDWIKVEDKARLVINYIDAASVAKIKVRNTFGRYISFRSIVRWYQNPKAGSQGSFKSGFGTSTTNCSIYADSANCKTTSFPSGKYTPGKPFDPGGVRQEDITYLIDCLTRRHFYKGDWYSIEKKIPEPIANNYCSKIETLQISTISKYQNGTPSEKDKIALEVLPDSDPSEIEKKYGVKD